MKKSSLLLVSTLLIAGLVSCSGGSASSDASTNTNSSSSNTAVSSSQGGNTGTSSSSTKVTKTYAVKSNTPSGITITSDKEQYAPLETVILTVSVNAGVTISKIYYNSKEATKVNDTTYTFTMPNRAVTVTCEASISGEMTIQGDALATFTQEGNIFVARNVKFSTGNGEFKVVISKDGYTTTVPYVSIDRTKCFADIDLPYKSGSTEEITGQVATGCTYDFYYDASNGSRPLYIKRVKVDTLPNSVATLDSMFDGKVQSMDSAFPDNLTSVTVDSSSNSSVYSWKYDSTDNESLVTYTSRTDNTKTGYEYRKYDEENGVFKWVDTTASNSGSVGKSGKYKVTNYKINAHGETDELNDDDEWDETRQYINPMLPTFEVSKDIKYNLYNLEREFMYGYRVGMVVQDYVKSSNVSITSTATSSGTEATGFTTTVVSSKTYDSSSATDSSETKEKIHYEYRATIDFGVAGEFKSVNYTMYTFDESLYNFTSDTFISGDAESNLSKGTIGKTLKATYTYNEDIDVDFDSTPYFISSIDSVTVNDSLAGTGNVLNSGDQLDATDSTTGLLKYVTINASPSTALDKWQYGVSESSDENVIRWNDIYRRYEADKVGTSTLTISNFGTKDVKTTVDVSVVYTTCLRSVWLNAAIYIDGYSRDEITSSNSASIYSGSKYKFKLGASGNKPNGSVALPPDLTATCSLDGIQISLDLTNMDMIVDATNCNVTTATKFTITFNSAYFLESDGVTAESPSVINFTINPTALTSIDDMAGTYQYDDESTSATLNVKASSETVTIGEKTYNTMLLGVGDDIYNIAYTIDLHSGLFKSAFVYDATSLKKLSDYDLQLSYYPDDGTIGVYLATSSWDGQDSITTDDILGYNDEDEDSPSYQLAVFTKVN